MQESCGNGKPLSGQFDSGSCTRDMNRLYERISMMLLSEEEKLDAFRGVYLGIADEELGELRYYFVADMICNFGRKRFKD